MFQVASLIELLCANASFGEILINKKLINANEIKNVHREKDNFLILKNTYVFDFGFTDKKA